MITYVNWYEIFKCALCFSYWHNHTSHLVSVMHCCSLRCFSSVFWYFFGTWMLLNASACCKPWPLCSEMLQPMCNRLSALSPPYPTRHCKSTALPSSLNTKTFHLELREQSWLLDQNLKVCITEEMKLAHIWYPMFRMKQVKDKIMSSLSQDSGLSLQTSQCNLSGKENSGPHQSDSFAPSAASFQTNWACGGNGITNL